MSQFLQPTVILLRDTEANSGTGHIISNINACQAIVDTVRTTLGPRGMDKLIYQGNEQTISNDGATIMNLLDIVHPAAKTLVDIAKSQDDEVGDGTTSVVVLCGQLLGEAKRYLEDGVHPRVVIRGLREGCRLAVAQVHEMGVPIDRLDDAKLRDVVQRCAATAMNSKLIATHRDLFSKMVVDAVLLLDDDLPLDMIGIKKEAGGALEDTIFVEGVAFKKTFSYAGFEQQPKLFTDCAVLCLNVELELKQEKDNAEVRITDPKQYQAIVDAEWRIIFEKLERCVQTGAKVVLSRLAIGDLATQYFADRDVFCAGRVPDEDMRRVCAATGAKVQTSVNGLPVLSAEAAARAAAAAAGTSAAGGDKAKKSKKKKKGDKGKEAAAAAPAEAAKNGDAAAAATIESGVLGHCGRFEERQVGKERYNFFTECSSSRTSTIILRGGGEHFIDEADRSLHDAIMIARRTLRSEKVVGGGGAVEMECSRKLAEHALTVGGKQQLVIEAFARALEGIPRQLAENSGFDPIDCLNALRAKHAGGDGQWYGVDIENEGVCDTYEKHVWEPSIVKINSFTAATEAACVILSVDETIKAEKKQEGQ